MAVVVVQAGARVDALRPARASVSGPAMAPAISSTPSTPSVSPAIAWTLLRPSRPTASDSRNSTLRPPRPLPFSVTVVSPPDSSTQGVGERLALGRHLARDAGHRLAQVFRFALQAVAQDVGRVAGAARHVGGPLPARSAVR